MGQPARLYDLADTHSRFQTAFNSGDVEGLLELYDEVAQLFAKPGEPPARGKQAIREALKGFLAMKGTMELDTVLMAEAGDVALLQGKWTLKGTGADGNPFQMGGTSAEVLRRRPSGAWVYVIDNPFAA